MIVEQIYTDNSLRNFNYIIACEHTKKAVVIDPLRVDLILKLISEKGYFVNKIINTHEHADHTDGNRELVKETNAEVYCHYKAVDKVPCAKFGLLKDDVITIGDSIKLQVLDTPGHTLSHVCLLASENNSLNNNTKYAIFSGDTLFNAGAGNVYSGNVDDLYNTFIDILYKLPNSTLVYPGHDYLENNLKFTVSREPSNTVALDLLEKLKNHDPHNPLVTTLGMEKEFNTFFRLNNLDIINKLSQDISDFPSNPTAKQVFVALRNIRNNW